MLRLIPVVYFVEIWPGSRAPDLLFSLAYTKSRNLVVNTQPSSIFFKLDLLSMTGDEAKLAWV